jgi:hypothetical protein
LGKAVDPSNGVSSAAHEEGPPVTIVWFVIWFLCDRIGDRETLSFQPVNWWAGTLLLVVALDLSKTHVLDRKH